MEHPSISLPAPFFQTLGREWMYRDRFHERESEIKQLTGAYHVTHCVSNSPPGVSRLTEQARDTLAIDEALDC